MNKRAIILFSLLLVGGGLAWLLVRSYTEREALLPAFSEKDLAKASATLHPNAPTQPAVLPEPPLDPSQRVRLAIGWLGLPDEARNGQAADLLTAELTSVKGLELVDRQSLGTVLRELELNLSGLMRAKDAVRVGKLLRAEWFLLGTSATVAKTNPIIAARIVDGRTGIMRDVGVFTPSGDVSELAADLAGFVRQCRQNASSAKPHTFLAVGSFADVGINTRQAAFPQQLRAYLTRAYQPSQVTLLEREQVNILLQEVRLDLAGLTDDAGARAPQPMQSAFWLVNGFYQSFETSGHEVELVLQVNRAFGRTTNFTFRAQPDETLFRKVKDAIDSTLAQASPTILAPTRRSEARQQMDMGKDLFNAGTGGYNLALGLWLGGGMGQEEQDFTKRRGYLTEAVRAFETVLLLEPDNPEARFYLSVCCCDQSLGRHEEGLGYLRELAGSPTEEKWSEKARVTLARFYSRTDRRQAVQWFNEAASHAQSPRGAAGYRSMAQQILAEVVAEETASQGGVQTDAQSRAILEARMFEQVESARSVLKGKGGIIDCSYGLEHFMGTFGTNKAAAADRIIKLLPTLTQKFPDMSPHLLSSVVSFQVATNAPVIAEFRRSLATCAEHPENVLGCAKYFENILCYPYDWCFSHRLYALAAELVEAKHQASLRRPEIGFNERDKVRLAFAHLRLERWGDALSVLEDLGNVSIIMQADGPWGRAFDPFLPTRQAAFCREKMGLAQPAKTSLTALGEPCLCLHTPAVVAAFPDGLWVAIGGRLLQLGFDLQTNKVVRLPIPDYAEISALCLGPEQVWIGTVGEGLVEYDKASGKCRLLTEKNGLLVNYISSLCLQEKILWIGFGREQAGGLGSLDLRTGQLSAFTPTLPSDPLAARDVDPRDGPPRHAVSGLAVASPGELWMQVSGRGLCRYRLAQKAWDTASFGNGVGLQCFGLNGDGLIGGFSLAQVRLTLENEHRPGETNRLGTTDRVMPLEEASRLQADPAMRRRIRGSAIGDSPNKADLRLCRFGEATWRSLGDNPALPSPPNCLLLDGSDIWLGGPAYVAVFDLGQNKIRRVWTIPARSVDRIQVAGGFLWVQFDQHLHKAPLSATR
jgi:hypothetical protein